MNRKRFLASVIPLAAVTAAFRQRPVALQQSSASIPFLKKGDTIAITCPSGFITANDCASAIAKLQEWGFRVKLGNTIGAKNNTFAGTDQERREDLQRVLDDPQVQAILLGRGGYGAVRIIDSLDFTRFKQAPKWIIGFSDATVFHFHVMRHCGLPTLHSKMCNSFPDDFRTASDLQKQTIESIRQCLTGENMQYNAPANPSNRAGKASGLLIGGNLSVIHTICGSPSDVDVDGKILFLEDVGEYAYKIDGMLWNLKRSGKLARLAGLIVGKFRLKPDDEGEAFGHTLEQMILEKVRGTDYPVCFDFPVGHVLENYALRCGVQHELTVAPSGATLTTKL